MTAPDLARSRNSRPELKGLIIGWILVAALLLSYNSYRYNNEHDELANAYQSAAQDAAIKASEKIGGQLDQLARLTERVAADLANHAASQGSIKTYLEQALADSDGISALTAGYSAHAMPGSFKRSDDAVFQFLIARKRNQEISLEFGQYSEETIRQTPDIDDWYADAMDKGDGTWNEPYYSTVTKTWWAAGHSTPLFDSANERAVGVVAAELTLSDIRDLAYDAISENFKDFPVEASYAFILSEEGYFVSHPDPTFVDQRRTIADFSDDKLTNVEIIPTLELVTAGDSKTAVHLLEKHHDKISGQDQSVYFARVAQQDWWIGIVIDQRAIDESVEFTAKRHFRKIGLLLSVLSLVFGVVALLARLDRGSTSSLIVASAAFSICCLTAIAYVWSIKVNLVHTTGIDDHRLVNPAISAKIRLRYKVQNDAGTSTPQVIPTGLFIQSLEFSSANNVTLTGYMWQKYSLDSLKESGPPDPLIFPESEETEITQSYAHEYLTKDANGEAVAHKVFGWYFKAVLRQEFDYSEYPFDRENVWIRLWHGRPHSDVLLTPDYAAYESTDPSKFPGLEMQDFVIEGWQLAGSYFSYRENSYNTNFGSHDHQMRKNFPELYFNIALQRDFLNAFIVSIIPLAVIALLLFLVLFTIRTDAPGTEFIGFNVSGVLGFCAALFFVIILEHTSMRSQLVAQGIIYLETFYFVMYVALMAIALNAILVAQPEPPRWIAFRDNLIPRLLYWPLLALLSLIITVFPFRILV